MKPLLFVISIALNVGLVLCLMREQKPVIAAAVAASPSKAAITPASAATWSGLKTDDLPTLVSRLRQAGFPPMFISALVWQQLGEIFSGQRKAVVSEDNLPFWQAAPITTPEQLKELDRLETERRQMLRDLLGDDAFPLTVMGVAYERRRFGNLSPDKIEAIKRVLTEFRPSISPVSREEGNAQREAGERALTKVLSPEEWEDYILRNNFTAKNLQNYTVVFEPTEEEFRTLFRIQNAYDKKYTYPTEAVPTTPEYLREAAEARQRRNEDIVAALGPERGPQFLRETTETYTATTRFINRLGLPRETTRMLWDFQQDFEKRATDLRADSQLDTAERNAQLAALGAEAKTKTAAALGERGFNAYQQNGISTWLRALEPPRAPAPASP